MAGKIFAEQFAMVPDTVLFNPKVTAPAMKLWCLLQRHGNKDDRIFPGRDRLGQQMGCTPRHVDRLLDELVAAEVLKVKYTKGQVNQYFLYPFGHTRPATLDTDVHTPLDTDVHRSKELEPEKTAREDTGVPGPTEFQRPAWADQPEADHEMNLTKLYEIRSDLKKRPKGVPASDTPPEASQALGS